MRAQAMHHQQMHMMHNYGPPAYQPGPPSFGMPPYGPQPPYGAPPPFRQQHQQPFPGNQRYGHMQSQANLPYGVRNEGIQYAFDALFKGLKSTRVRTNTHDRSSTPPPRKMKSGAAAHGQGKQKEYDSLHRVTYSRVNKSYSSSASDLDPSASQKKGRNGDTKIMLPAPQPIAGYMEQAAEDPVRSETPGHVLVILDLNGTVLFRPNRNAKTMIERPFLKPFMRYLFQNFKVMVWSSAKPDNVKALVHQALDNDLRSKLIAHWARDSFGLSPTNYQQNVQVYKNLRLVWSRDQIQQHHPDYATGGRFGQHNTVLIDDSAIKASAQPHNLLEIPEFSATPEQMEGDALREVAGYLQELRFQTDVSKFIKKEPFQCDGRWNFEWPNDIAEGGVMTAKATGKKKNKKRQANGGVVADVEAQSPQVAATDAKEAVGDAQAIVSKPTTPLPELHASMSSASLAVPA